MDYESLTDSELHELSKLLSKAGSETFRFMDWIHDNVNRWESTAAYLSLSDMFMEFSESQFEVFQVAMSSTSEG